MDAFPAIEGLSQETLPRRFGGRADKYAALLRAYADAHAEDARALRDHLAAGRLDEARQLAHAVKGASAMLGASGVQALAAALEKALADRARDEVIDQAFAAYEEARAILSGAIRAAL